MNIIITQNDTKFRKLNGLSFSFGGQDQTQPTKY